MTGQMVATHCTIPQLETKQDDQEVQRYTHKVHGKSRETSKTTLHFPDLNVIGIDTMLGINKIVLG